MNEFPYTVEWRAQENREKLGFQFRTEKEAQEVCELLAPLFPHLSFAVTGTFGVDPEAL